MSVGSKAITTRSRWEQSPFPEYPELDAPLDVDVVVVGGGVTGITTAWLLKEQGVKVALIEKNRLACADTAHTTAHLTYVTDARLRQIARSFGRDAAKGFWEAGRAAINEIERLVGETREDCEFRRIPGYLHAAGLKPAQETVELQAELELAQAYGFPATMVARPPTCSGPGVLFPDQAKFHPRRYLAALARQIAGSGSHVFEHTPFEETDESPFVVKANGQRIRCEYLVLATHNPLMGRTGTLSSALFQTKLALYTSYVLGARLPEDTLPEALFWDTRDPYDYLRIDAVEEGKYAIFGGEDVKTGQEEDPASSFRKLEERLLARLPTARIVDRWLGQVVETDDGLPFIGENAERQFIATGFAGNGFTFGTLAAVMARDKYIGNTTPWQDLFAVDRAPFHGGTWRYLSENVDYPFYFVKDRLKPVPGTLEMMQPGEGALVLHEGRRLAAFKDASGTVTLLSPVCTHMKCLVRWNVADRTWDCPCHGSRFKSTGEVLGGPAESGLERY